MELIYGVVVVVLVLAIYNIVSKKGKVAAVVGDNDKLPYKVKDDFLTNAESSFYHSLKLCVGDKAVICPKVGLKDIFFIGKGVGKDYMKYFTKIAQKHVDFLLCDPSTMRPLCGIELDDISHTKKMTYERDLIVEKIYRDANFELIRLSSKYSQKDIEVALTGVFNRPQVILAIPDSNETILCPKCSEPMVLHKTNKGQNSGKEFYGCINYPQCKQVINK